MARKNMGWLLAALSVIAVLSLLGAGCGAAPTPQIVEKEVVVEKKVVETVVVEKEVPVEKPVVKTVVVEKVVTATPSTPRVVRIRCSQDPGSLNPQWSTGFWGDTIMAGIYDAILDYDEKGNPIPGLAESWEVSDDGMTYTFHLRSGIKFHDGTEFNAEAVKYNFDMTLDPERPGGALPAWKYVEKVEVVDDLTVRFVLSEPRAGFLNRLVGGDVAGYIASPTAYEKLGREEFARHPVGTGPFRFVKWEGGVEVVLERNPDYWREGLPKVDKVIWRQIEDDTAAVLNMKSGDLDIYPLVTAAQLIPSLKEIPGVEILSYETGMLLWIQLNTVDPPFDKLANRQALYYALDAQAIADVVFKGEARPGQGMIPPISWGFDPEAPALKRDLDKAKAKLAEAGNPDGFEFTVSLVAGPPFVPIAQVMQSSLAEVGINMVLQQNERARHVEIIRTDKSAVQAILGGMLPIRLNPEWWLEPFRCDTPTNFPRYCNAEYDELLERSSTLLDREERKAVLHKLNRIK